jgi:hypothetical protein
MGSENPYNNFSIHSWITTKVWGALKCALTA